MYVCLYFFFINSSTTFMYVLTAVFFFSFLSLAISGTSLILISNL